LADFTPPNAPALTEQPEAKSGPSNLRLRVIYAFIGAAMLLGSVWYSAWTFALFFAAVQVKMLLEFYRMMRAGGYAPAKWIGAGASLIIFGFAFAGLSYSYPNSLGSGPLEAMVTGHHVVENWSLLARSAIVVLAILSLVLLLREIVLWPSTEQPFVNIAAVFGGIFYVSIPMTTLLFVGYGPNGYDYRRIFGLLFLVWASDIGAYAAGKTFGKHKLAPSISPGKTWEGWAGGFLLTLAVGWALSFMMPDVPLAHRLVAAGVVAIFGPLGDLAESMLKRSVGVKDSGTMMPGHGGLLDRFDAFLLVLPVLALLQLLAG
jgi:phosphatidate cytidylyltransferase